ncbi:RNA recognition motif-containing family protein [Dorcoceras hygrometricum]|uniref:RNA recognition motif-containing family protein n=1 Tax=Dorcoceras hygrometricum TaxID=472368 RepID=A0A2Z7CIW9_9LAMI|nr:RNA recognition motif-containing family protein [Dorcoceras hygrometricum]
MAKKAKNPSYSNKNSCFGTLFGEIPEQHSSANSLFSESNPFRRKIQENPGRESNLRLGFTEKDVGNQGALEDSASAELKGGKKIKEDKAEKESSNLVTDSVESEEKTKSTTNELKRLKSIGVETRKKKKRKRDEVEVDYETKRYGVADGNENVGASGVVAGKRKKMDNPEDTMVSKEAFDDESKLLRTVFVGNLPLKIKKKELVKEFVKFGEVESVRIRSVPIVDGKISRKGAVIRKQFNENGDSCHAYIVFSTEDSAQESLTLNMAVIGGNHIRVDRACPPCKKLKGENSHLYDNKRTVFVGNLPFDVKDEEIYQLFSGIKNLESSIEAVRVIRDPVTSLGKGIAYVLFKTKDAADSILMSRNLKLRDRKLRLSRSSGTPLKRKNPLTPESGNHPAKKVAVNSRTPESDSVKVNFKDILSYQGVRASKAGTQKKSAVPRARTGALVKLKSEPAKEQMLMKRKRPAVAARKKEAQKAARKMGSEGSASGAKLLVGAKRKFGNRTPQNADPNKKARKFR